MQQYEICFITIREEDKKVALELLKKQNVKVLYEQNIGRRKFSYSIKKESAGFYHSIFFTIENTKNINPLNKLLVGEQKILRYLIVKNDINIKELTKPKQQKLQIAKKLETKIPHEIIKKESVILEPRIEKETAPATPERRDGGQGKGKTVKKNIKEVKKPLAEKPKETSIQEKAMAEDEAERIKKLEEKLDELLKE